MVLLPAELAMELPSTTEVARAVVRLGGAAAAGCIIGLQREHSGKSAGLRTHMLVALGAAVFVLAALDAPIPSGDVTRIVQGIASGIGFIGAGAILKLSTRERVKGLTTAAGVWMTAAMGAAAGLGRVWLALLVAGLSWVVLAVLGRFESEDRGHTIE